MTTKDKLDIDFDFFSFIKFILENKLFILRMIVVFSIISIIFNFVFRPIIYTSTITIHPVNSSAESVIPQSLSRILDSTGVSDASNAKYSKNLAIINSRQFIDSFIKKRDIAKYLIAVHSYDSKSGTLSFNDKLFDSETGKIREELLNNELLYREFNNILFINSSRDTELVDISISYLSPYAASDIANWLIEDLNIYLANKDAIKAQRNIEFLNSTVDTNQKNYVDLSNLYNSLKLQEIKKLMLAQASTEYAYEIIDPAFPILIKSSPKRLRDSALGIILGGLISIFLLIFQRIFEVFKARYHL